MIRRKLVTAIALAGLLPAGLANAVGLGQVELHSALNQPLDAEIELINAGDLDNSQIFVKLASQEDFERAGVDREYFLTKINFNVVLDRKTGQNVIRLKTRDRVQEPFLNFVVEARWPNGRVLREYTVLLDLPVTQGKASAPVRPATVSATREATQPEPAAAQPVTSTATVESRSASAPVSTRPAGDRMHSPVSAGSYRIQQGDSLWNIAQNHKPGSDASVQQTMLAIQAMNPEAFYRNNINLIKAGYVLRLPDAATVNQLSYEEARQEVAAQNQAWRDGSSRTVPSRISAAVEATPVTPAEEPEGRLELSASGDVAAAADGTVEQVEAPVGQPAETAASEAGVDAVEETLAATEEEKAELQDKLEVMEDQVKTMERLAELKDQQMAALQEEEANKPKPAVSEEEGEGLSSRMMMYIGGGLLALLAIVAFLFGRRKKSHEPSPLPQQPVLVARTGTMPPVTDADLHEEREPEETQAGHDMEDVATAETMEADIAEPGQEEEAPVDVDSTVTSMDAIPVAPTEAQTGDVVGEADIYMSLGRHAQAASMLKGAIDKEPGNMKLHLKLLEVYVDANDRDAFHQHFVQLQGVADAQTIGRAKELLLGVDDAAGWMGEKRNTQEMPTVTMDEVDDSLLEAAPEDDVPFAQDAEPAVTEEDQGDTREMGVVELDDTGDFDFGSFGAKEAEKAVDEDEPETIDLGVNDDLDFLAGTDESGTKLDLARAYIDMGDIDGARDILQEVIQEGNAAAKEEARKLLDSL